MKTKLLLFWCVLCFLAPAIVKAQSPERIHVAVTAVSTYGQGVCEYTLRDYFIAGGIGAVPYNYSLGGNENYPDPPWQADGFVQCQPNTPINYHLFTQNNLRTFPSFLTLKVNEYIFYVFTDLLPYETNAFREVPFSLTARGNDYTPNFNLVLGRTTSNPLASPPVKAGHYATNLPTYDDIFDSDGFLFSVTVLIPQVPITGFNTYDKPARTVTMDRFCYGEPIYADTYYKDQTRKITNAHFQYEYRMRGRNPIIVNQDLTLPSLRLETGEIAIPSDLSTPIDPTDTVSVWLRVRMVGPNHGGVDGLHGPWSQAKKLLIYPKPPVVNMTNIDPNKLLVSKNDLVEKNSDFEVHHVSCAKDSTGQIVIRKLNQTSRYMFTIKNTTDGKVMNYRSHRAPTPGNPIILPQDALDDRPNANTPFRFAAGVYELKIEAVDSVTNAPLGCHSTQQFRIKQPEVFQANVSKLKYHGFDVSCFNSLTGLASSDGRIAVNPSGGIGPFDFTLKGYANGVEVNSQTLRVPGNTVLTGLAARDNGVLIEYRLSAQDDATCLLNNLVQATHIYTKEYKTTGIPSEGSLLTLSEPGPIRIDTLDVDFEQYYNHNIKCSGWKDSLEVFITGGTHRYAAWVDGNGLSNYQRRDSINENMDQLIFSQLSAGTYDIRVVDRNGCQATKTFAFQQPALLEIENSGIISPDCFGNNTGEIKINGMGGVPLPGGERYRYTMTFWPNNFTPPSTNKRGEEVVFTNLAKGNYSINIVDTLGCQRSFSFFVTEPANLVTTVATNDIACYDENTGQAKATIGGGTAPYTLQWLDAAKEIISSESQVQPGNHYTLENQRFGQYYAKLVDAHDCNLESVFVISQPSSPLVIEAMENNIHHISCNGSGDGQVTLTATGGWTTSPYEIGKNKNDLRPNAFSFTSLGAGNHRFYVRDFEGCIDSVDVTLHEPEILQAQAININAVSCFGKSDGSFTPQITGGTSPYEINVNTSGWQPAESVNNLIEGNYAWQVRDHHGCVTNANALVTSPAVLEAALLSSSDTQCGESNGKATISVTGGNAPYQIAWTLDEKPIAGDLHATDLSSGVYTVSITDTKSCETSLPVGISDSDAATISVQQITPVKCFGGSDGSASLTVAGGTLPYAEIRWTTGQTGLQATGLKATAYVVSVKDQVDCISTKQIIIPGPDALVATFKDVVMPHCFGEKNGSVRAEASGGTAPYHYHWADPSTLGDHIKNVGAGTLPITITDNNGCILDTSYDLQQPPQVSVDIEGEEFYCTGQTVKLDAGNPGSTYLWESTIGAGSTAQIFEATQTGTYKVTVKDARGCTGTGSRDLMFDSNILRADFISSSEAIAGDTVVLINVSFPIPDSTYWTLPDGVTIVEASSFWQYIVFPDSGVYSITLSATKGECFDQLTDSITVLERTTGSDEETGRTKANLIAAVNIHPNPSNGKFKISAELREFASIDLQIFSSTGGSPWAAYHGTNADYYEINVEMNPPPGVYYILLRAENEKTMKRIVIH